MSVIDTTRRGAISTMGASMPDQEYRARASTSTIAPESSPLNVGQERAEGESRHTPVISRHRQWLRPIACSIEICPVHEFGSAEWLLSRQPEGDGRPMSPVTGRGRHRAANLSRLLLLRNAPMIRCKGCQENARRGVEATS
jgi:hypothetical protein